MISFASSPLEDDYIDVLADEVIDFLAAECIFADEFEEDLMGASFIERGDSGLEDDSINIFAA